MSDAFSAISSQLNAQPIEVTADTSQAEAQVAALDVPVTIPVDADASEAEAAIGGLGEPQTIDIDADTTEAETAVGSAGLDAPITIPIDGDTAQAQADLDQLEATPITVPVEADTAPAQESIDQLGTSSSATQTSLDQLSGGVEALSATTGIAKGEVGELGGFISNISPASATAVAGLAAFGAIIGEATNLAADAQAQNKRFTETFGLLAEEVSHVNVGGLNTDLETLARTSGTTFANVQAVATRIGLLGQSAGASNPQIVATTQNLLALGATISVNNPRLGDAATVTDKLTAAFARGGRALAPFGIALTSAQINAEALAETGKETADQLTIFEKATAGANLALGQFGDTLGTKFSDGASNAQVQLRALRVTLEEGLVKIGTPLLDPLVKSLQGVVPVALEVGEVIGNLARIVLPFVGALGPVLLPVAGGLKLVADGLGFIADGLGHLPPPLLAAIAAGILLIGINATTAFGLVGTALTLFEAATGPIGLTLLAVGALGAALHLFGSESKDAQVDTKGFVAALNDTAAASEAATGKTVALTVEVEKQLTTLLAFGKAGETAADGLALIGTKYDAITTALLGTDEQFQKFRDSQLFISDTFAKSRSLENYVAVLEQTRDELGLTAKANIDAAVATGLLTQEQVDAALGTSEAGASVTALIAVYGKLKPQIEANAEAQGKQTLAQSLSTGTLRDAIAAFDPATDAVATYTQKLVDLGVAEADADALAKDQVASLQATKDETILSSAAVLALNLAFVQGRIGAGQLEGGVFALGTSLEAARGDVSGLTSEIEGFAAATTSALPNAGAAVQQFNSDVQAAFTALVSASKAGGSAVEAAQKRVAAAQEALSKAGSSAAASTAKNAAAASDQVTAAQEALARAQEKAGDSAAKSIQTAQSALDAANRKVQSLRASGIATVTAIDSAQLAVVAAQERLNRAIAEGSDKGAGAVETATARVAKAREKLNETIEAGGSSGATSVKNAQDQLAKANADLVSAQEKAGADVKAAQEALQKAVNPQVFIDTLAKEAKAIGDFQRNLATLVAEGLGNLAGELARKGPEAGGALAQAFVDDRVKAIAADGAVRLVTTATDRFTAFAKGPESAAAMGVGGQALADAANRGYAGRFAIENPTRAGLDRARALILAAQPGLEDTARGLAVAGVLAFQGEFGRLPTIAEVQAGRSRDALAQATNSFSTAGVAVGRAGTTGFEQGFDPASAVQSGLTTAQGEFDAGKNAGVAQAARAGGRVVGFQFDKGIVDGIEAGQDQVFNAALAAAAQAQSGANTALGISSPSTVGMEIGGQFVEGVALGIASGVDRVTEATSTITNALTGLVTKVPTLTLNIPKVKIPQVELVGAGAAVTTASGQVGARQVDVKIDLHRVDVNPTELSQELGWRLG